jgi:hypothetical protein
VDHSIRSLHNNYALNLVVNPLFCQLKSDTVSVGSAGLASGIPPRLAQEETMSIDGVFVPIICNTSWDKLLNRGDFRPRVVVTIAHLQKQNVLDASGLQRRTGNHFRMSRHMQASVRTFQILTPHAVTVRWTEIWIIQDLDDRFFFGPKFRLFRTTTCV